jgi:chromosome segregation ATPase
VCQEIKQILVNVVLLACLLPQALVAQESLAKRPAKKVWTNDDLQSLSLTGVSAAPESRPPDTQANIDVTRNHYVRAKDPKSYITQLRPLREQVEEIDRQLKIVQRARKDGTGVTGAMALDHEPDGVTTEAQVELLQKKRSELVNKIEDLEAEALRNEVPPGALRSEIAPRASTITRRESTDSAADEDPDVAKTKKLLRDENEHLERAKKELDLLRRGLDLEQRQVYSNPEYLSRRIGESKLTSIESQISGKQQEIEKAQKEIAQSEDHLEDLELNRPAHGGSKNNLLEVTAPDSPGTKQTAKEEKGENYWRKRFTDLRYKIRMAETELDILQRELNVLLVQYDPNPAKAMRETVTRKEINDHRKAITDKQKEIEGLERGLSDLQDELRHAGGNPGWARD